jgi:BirA family transcriptional regulator, biotin operon repressor / biotin---[acetyl-CoA-carboxylase] ligase
LSALRLQRALVEPGGWRRVEVVSATGSTNGDVCAAARAGEPAGLVLIAEEQSSGRGRLDRSWQAPPRSALLMSVLLRPTPPPSTWTLLPLVAGLAVVEAVRGVSQLPAALKWPNDVMVRDRKLGGILVQLVDSAVVVGLGLNVSIREGELPVASATSIGIEGGISDREALAKEVLRALRRRFDTWTRARGEATAVLPMYREVCSTIGRQVRVELPAGGAVEGVARDVDDAGRLLLRADDGERVFTVGDVVHVRAV